MKKTGEIDIKLGQKIANHRATLGLSRKELADSIGITHQQLQKYEKGLNRISVARLYDISAVFKLPVTKFLENDLLEEVPLYSDSRSLGDIIKYINRISDETKLLAIKNLIKSISVDEARADI